MEKKQALVHWADQTAEKIIRERGDLESYTCASGITPSGTVHIGNFREIISVDLVVRALRDRGKTVRFIYSWDDYDVFRKVPANMPKPEELKAFLRFPITMVPDTFGRDENYARHHERDVETVLPQIGINPEYLYQAQRYQQSLYAEGMKIAMDQREKIKALLNMHRDERHKIVGEYQPVSVFCTQCHKDTTTVDGWDGQWSLHYQCECGHAESLNLQTAKTAKLGWRVDWPMRWHAENVIFEPAGKDHHSQGGSFDTARLIAKEIYGQPAPISFRYDFIGLKGLPGKMSSSKGKVVSLPDVLEVYVPEVVRYLFASTRPNTEFSISFDLDVIKIYEDYDKTERIAWGVEKAKNDNEFLKQRRIYELSQVAGMPPSIAYQVPFRHLCNLLQINEGNIDAVLALFDDIRSDQIERFKQRCTCAWKWICDSGAPEEFKFSLKKADKPLPLHEQEVSALQHIRRELLPQLDTLTEKALSTALYDTAHQHNLEPKCLFTAVYQALIGKPQGPRLAGFMKIVGKERLDKLLAVYG